MSLGEERVRINFNPSANPQVEDIKRRCADAIDWCNDQPKHTGEQARCFAEAMTLLEVAAMWAVKGVTFP